MIRSGLITVILMEPILHELMNANVIMITSHRLWLIWSHLDFSHIWWSHGSGCNAVMIKGIHSVWDHISSHRSIRTDRLVSLSYMMTYGIRMYYFDDQWNLQCMRLYIHIEKYNHGFINICVMGFGSSFIESTNPIQNIFYVKICFTPGTYAWWANIYQYKCENVWW